jgi:hypothetical protein
VVGRAELGDEHHLNMHYTYFRDGLRRPVIEEYFNGKQIGLSPLVSIQFSVCSRLNYKEYHSDIRLIGTKKHFICSTRYLSSSRRRIGKRTSVFDNISTSEKLKAIEDNPITVVSFPMQYKSDN